MKSQQQFRKDQHLVGGVGSPTGAIQVNVAIRRFQVVVIKGNLDAVGVIGC